MILKYFAIVLTLTLGSLSIQMETNNIEQTLTGKAIKIVDGDTFDLLVGSVTYRIRLNGIDTPERGQDFYQNAKNALGNWCRNQTLRVTYKSKDRNGRFLGDVYTSSSVWVNLKLVQEGMAWHFKKYSSDKTLATAEIKARNQKFGLWGMKNAISPWDWRKGKRN